MRALVVCRFPVYRDALARLVDGAFGPDTAESYAELDDALKAARTDGADLMLVDADPDAEAFAGVKRAAEAIQPAPVVLFSMLPAYAASGAYETGLRGCVPRTAEPELIVAALRLILAGGLYFSDLSNMPGRQRLATTVRARLSGRQMEVLGLVETGQTNKEIAKALGISVATVKLHVQAILNITGARNRTEAALRARRQA